VITITSSLEKTTHTTKQGASMKKYLIILSVFVASSLISTLSYAMFRNCDPQNPNNKIMNELIAGKFEPPGVSRALLAQTRMLASVVQQNQYAIVELQGYAGKHDKVLTENEQSIGQPQTQVQQLADQDVSDHDRIQSLEGASQQIKEQLQNTQAQLLHVLNQRKADHQRLGELEALVLALQAQLHNQIQQ
jgi:fructose-specific phosphotransferase system component IIB